jgi:hypothetical protein
MGFAPTIKPLLARDEHKEETLRGCWWGERGREMEVTASIDSLGKVLAHDCGFLCLVVVVAWSRYEGGNCKELYGVQREHNRVCSPGIRSTGSFSY